MVYARIHDGDWCCPKGLKTSYAAHGFLKLALSYLGHHYELEGLLPACIPAVLHMDRPDDLDAILKELVLNRYLDVMPDGFLVHDYLKYNDTAEAINAKKERARVAALARWSKPGSKASSKAPGNALHPSIHPHSIGMDGVGNAAPALTGGAAPPDPMRVKAKDLGCSEIYIAVYAQLSRQRLGELLEECAVGDGVPTENLKRLLEEEGVTL